MAIDVHTLRRMTWYVAGAAALLAGLTFVFAGPWRGLGAAVGGAVAVANWLAMRWVGERLLRANDRGRMIWGTLLAVKMGATLGLIWLILATGWVDPMGFAVGMSGLVLGVLAGTFHLAASGSPVGSADRTPAGEES